MGGICIGCTMPGFPDKFSHLWTNRPAPCYRRLPFRRMGVRFIVQAVYADLAE